MYSRRENILRTLRRQDHDRMPAFFFLDNYNYPDPMPIAVDTKNIIAFQDVEGLVDLSEYLGLDILLRIVPEHLRIEGITPATGIIQQELDHNRTLTRWQTPSGYLQLVAQHVSEANANFSIEYPIKNLSDYAILRSFWETQKPRLVEENIRKTEQYLKIIGDTGIAYVVIPPTPVMDLNRNWVGLGNFIYHLMDATQQVESLMELMTDVYCQQLELIAANTPCQVLVFWDEANSFYLSPKLFETYELPVLQRYAAIAHQYGKILVIHSCGKIQSLLKHYSRSGVDAIDWVTPPPTGDVDPQRASEILGDSMSMILTPAPSILRNEPAAHAVDHLHQILGGLDVKKNLLLGIPAPVGTPLETYRSLVETLVNHYGIPINSSQKFGNILNSSHRI